jgi:hypothetical protein
LAFGSYEPKCPSLYIHILYGYRPKVKSKPKRVLCVNVDVKSVLDIVKLVWNKRNNITSVRISLIKRWKILTGMRFSFPVLGMRVSKNCKV